MTIDIPKTTIDEYAKRHKLTPLEAYRDLFSQSLFNMITAAQEVGDLKPVLLELVKQTIGEGLKDNVLLH